MATIDRTGGDGFPHGTPDGHRAGCRGNAGCPNRGTTRMTCLEASLRYARDLHYRRAYNSGDIILDRDIPVDTEKEKARTAAIRHKFGGDLPEPAQTPRPEPEPEPEPEPGAAKPTPPAPPPSTPTVVETEPDPTSALVDEPPATATPEPEPALEVEPAEVPAADPEPTQVDPPEPAQTWNHGTVNGYDNYHCRCEPCAEAKRAKNAGARQRRKDRIEDGDRLPQTQEALAAARREIARLQARLAAPEPPLGQVEAEDEVLRLTVENGRLRADAASARTSLAELVALTRRPDTLAEVLRPPGISFDLLNGDLAITLHARMQESDVEALREYLGTAS